VRLETVDDLQNVSLAALRQGIARCRRQLAKDYLAIHGRKPEAPLLIQSKSHKGYRLDPTIVILDSPG
jgi:hypothetical protein